jgi:hypothetical protein
MRQAVPVRVCRVILQVPERCGEFLLGLSEGRPLDFPLGPRLVDAHEATAAFGQMSLPKVQCDLAQGAACENANYPASREERRPSRLLSHRPCPRVGRTVCGSRPSPSFRRNGMARGSLRRVVRDDLYRDARLSQNPDHLRRERG